MKKKNLLLWVITFVVVACVLTAAGILRSRRPSEKSLLFFPGLSEDKCASIEISEKEKTVKLHRKGDIWVVAGAQDNAGAVAGGLAGLADTAVSPASAEPVSPDERGYPVDSAMFASVMEKLQAMKKDELFSQNVEKQSLFEVDSGNGVFVTVRDNTGKACAVFRIGKNGPGWSSHYVRRDGSNDVYLVHGSIKYAFAADPERWRDKTITKFSATAARRITLVKAGGVTVTLDKTTDSAGSVSWNITAPIQHRAATDKVDEIVNTLARLSCMSWENNSALSDDSMGLAQPQLTVRVDLDGGTERVVLIGKKVGSESKYWVRTPSQQDVTFHVSSYTIEKFDKNADALKAVDAAPAAVPQS